MVLVNKKIMELVVSPPEDPDLDSIEDDLRIDDITSAVYKMEETEKSFYTLPALNETGFKISGASSPLGTPRSSRPCSINNNTTLLNSAVTLNSKNSAISRSYSSPRQFTLSASKGFRSASGLVENLKQSHLQKLTPRNLQSISASSFDYDANEEIPLEFVRSYKPPQKQVLKTEDIYTRACSYLGIPSSQTYVKQITSTREVCMANTSLSSITVKPIAISLVRDSSITHLDLSGNDLGPLGVMYIAEMLAVNDTIYEVNLSNTSPGRDGLKWLATKLQENKTLSVLRLESNSFDHTEMEYIVQLIKLVPNIKELYLGHNNLGYEGAKLLAAELEVNTSLLTLDLQWNHFRKQSASQLCRAIKANRGLRHLNIAWNGLGKEGCIALARALPHNTSLKSLDLTNNRIDIVALPFLLHGLVRNTSLEHLQLGKNPMTTEGVKAVIRAITGASGVALRYLNIDDIPVDKEFTQLVRTLQEQRDINVDHGVEMYGAIELTIKEHDPHDLNRFDPVMVLMEYMRIDNLRLIDLFGYFDTSGRGLVSRDNLRTGIATLGLPLTEHHLDCLMHDIDSKRDGFIDLEEFMAAHREMSKVVIQRTTKAKSKGKEDLGLKELKKILKELVEKRNKRNKEKASSRVKSAALQRANSASSNTVTAGRDKVRTKKASLIAQRRLSVAWTGAINKVEAMNKLKVRADGRRESTVSLPPIEREITFEIAKLAQDIKKANAKLMASDVWNVLTQSEEEWIDLDHNYSSEIEPFYLGDSDSDDSGITQCSYRTAVTTESLRE